MKTTSKLIGLLLVSAFLLGGCWFTREKAVDHYVNALSLHEAALDEDAILELQAAVKWDHEFSLAYSMMGDLYREKEQYDDAANAYETACQIDPWAFSDHLNLGQVYQILERFIEAIDILKRACQLQPESAEANYTLGVCYFETEKYEEAARFCQKAADLAPDDSKILSSLGDIYQKSEDPYKAITAYKQALEVDPSQMDVMIRLGTTYISMKRYGPAKLILEKAVAAGPDKPEPYIALGYCLLSQKDLPKALEAYQKATEIDASSYKALNGMGVSSMMLYIGGKKEDKQLAQQALNHWHKSLEVNSDQPKIKKLIDRYTPELYPEGGEAGGSQ
jgi:tetratricopeptide (TPR) repeat protein